MKSTHAITGLWLALILFTLTACSGAARVRSAWAPASVQIDGETSEWSGNFTLLEDSDVDVGIFNDDEHLYLSLVTTNRELRSQIMMGGLIVWFDPTGEQERSFGIHYPLGMGASMDTTDPAGSDFDQQDARLALLEEGLSQMRVLHGQESEGHLVDLNQDSNIEARISVSPAALSYELKLPLHKQLDTDDGVGARPGSSLAVGLETLPMERRMGPRDSGPGGGRRGGMGGMGARGGSREMMRGRRPAMVEVLSTWINVELAGNRATRSE